MLARSPAEITMADVVEALEGSIAPIECISQSADGSIVCARESAEDPTGIPHACPTKLLWTRVRFSIVRTLQETTLADLVPGAALGAAAALPDGMTEASLATGTTLPTIDSQPRPLTTGA